MKDRHQQDLEPKGAGRDNIVHALGSTAHAMRRHLDHSMHEIPGRTSAWGVMRHLSHHGPTTQADLARAVGVAGSTLTRRLEQMEDDGLIERTDDPDDGRRIIVALSERGENLRAEQRERNNAEIARLTEGAEPADIEALWRVIGVIRSNLVELHPEGEGPGGPGRRGGRGGRGGPGRRGRERGVPGGPGSRGGRRRDRGLEGAAE
ncbi:MarR family winged helix-turn-helix transcriptional regulator [Demequina oxidasica]|uniref:MarR family winged helix-turn-helix transcriptional regulator n=1 Tax=Demequina oxidasica TaxID=676199 RepID=UPI0007867310|nr:MarR family transcriptional regulator [Demequina oxidasica]